MDGNTLASCLILQLLAVKILNEKQNVWVCDITFNGIAGILEKG
jgi:hypothetical protein